MIGRIFDGIPGVGHVKGVIHYATGDKLAGDRAMYEATRSTAVMAGGAVGVLGGPAGMVAGAAVAGALADTVTSVVTDEPHGVIRGVTEIASDISDGKAPLGAVVRTGLIVGSDIIGGMGGASIGQCATNVITESAGKSLGKEIVKQVVKTEVDIVTRCALAHGYSRVLVETAEEKTKNNNWKPKPSSDKTPSSTGGSGGNSSSTGDSGGKSSSTSKQKSKSKKAEPSKSSSNTGSSSSGSSGGQAPNNNQNHNDKKEHYEEKTESHWEAFLKIFEKETLDEIVVGGMNIFKGLSDGQKRVLKKLIKEIRNSGYLNLERIVAITLKVLSQLKKSDITFQNFQSVIKFVLAYVHEQIVQRNDAYNQSPPNFPNLSGTYDERRIQIAKIVVKEIGESIGALQDLLNDLTSKIKDLMTTISPQFYNILAAVYHYFKHKCTPKRNKILTPIEYFDLARKALKRLRKLPQFGKLKDGDEREIVYEIYYARMGRRLKIVVKIQDGEITLSSCYWVDDINEYDEDGDEWINDEKLPRQ